MTTFIKYNVHFSTFFKCMHLIFIFSAFSVPCYVNCKTVRNKI